MLKLSSTCCFAGQFALYTPSKYSIAGFFSDHTSSRASAVPILVLGIPAIQQAGAGKGGDTGHKICSQNCCHPMHHGLQGALALVILCEMLPERWAQKRASSEGATLLLEIPPSGVWRLTFSYHAISKPPQCGLENHQMQFSSTNFTVNFTGSHGTLEQAHSPPLRSGLRLLCHLPDHHCIPLHSFCSVLSERDDS